MPLTELERSGWEGEYGDSQPWWEIIKPALRAVEAETAWAEVGGQDSKYVAKMVSFLTHCGVEVELGPLEDPQVVGRAQYEPIEKVWIAHPQARGAVLTAAHEAGHLLSYWRLRTRHEEPPPEDVRERLAFLYGWAILRWLDIPVGKDEWIAFDKD